MKENLISKFLKFSYGSWIGLILGLITTMITTRILPPDVLGQVSMFELFLQMGLILTIFGTDQSFIRFYYEEEENKRGALMYNSLKLPMKTSVLLILTIILFYKPITFFLVGAPDFSLAILLVLGIIFQLIFRYGQLVIRMEQKGNVYSLLQILQKLFNLCFIVGLYYFIGSEYEVLVLSKIFTLFLLFILSIYLGRKFWNLKNFYISDTRHSQMEIVKYGAPFVLTIFITWIFQSFDQVAIRHWRDFSELGLYAAAMRIVALVVVLSSTFTTFWTPVSYEKFIADPEDKAFFKNITIVVSFVMFLFAILTIAGKYLIVNLLGQQYLDAANIMPFLVFMPILMTISETTVIGINFYKKLSGMLSLP
ncbi:Lipopolysaccharide biosynthesis protein [Planococcus halocryophilus Or1]|uniref:lipopolysaccharide biosynthesis protein n=1 Tax=Planococcus halocryophilus TaxID=1215089 RepID=UPI0002B857C5|nr:oligosaccharide flippase family protein [Planococcus halocryophilus]EMF47448.1 Lipopolysaccharide biosynthesis protein [Planococcus halocryophilus Or1]